MRKISVAFAAILIAVVTINGATSSENVVAVPKSNLISSLIGAILEPILKAIGSVVNIVTRLVRDLGNLVLKTLPDAIIGLVRTISDAIQKTTSKAVRDLLEAILGLIEAEVDNILKLIQRLVDRQSRLQKILVDIENAILDGLGELRIFLENCLGKVPIQVIQIVRRLTSDITKCASGTIDLIANELKRVNGIAAAVSGLVDGVLGKIAQCLDNDEDASVTCLEGVRGEIVDSLKEIEDALKLNDTVIEAVTAVQKCIQVVINAANSSLTC